jgi:hypothetical protein
VVPTTQVASDDIEVEKEAEGTTFAGLLAVERTHEMAV